MEAIEASWLERLFGFPAEVDDDHRMRTKFALAATSIFCVLATVRTVQFVISGNHPQAIVLAVCAAIAATLPFVLRRTRSLAFTGHALSSLVFFGIVRAAWVSGGAGSPALIALAIVPLVAVFITGKRGGTIWAVIIGMAIVGFAALDAAGMTPALRASIQSVKAATATGAFVLMLTTLALALAYERAREATAADAARRVAAVEARAQKKDQEQREHLAHLMKQLAHEGNNTLMYVMSDVELAERAVKDPAVKEALGQAAVGAERLKDILHDVQTVTRRRGNADSGSCDARAVITRCLDEAKASLERFGVVAECDLDGSEPWPARVSRDALALGLRNLIGGVVPETKLSIRVSRARARIIVEASSGRPRELGIEAARHALEPYGATLDIDWSSVAWRGVIQLQRPPADED